MTLVINNFLRESGFTASRLHASFGLFMGSHMPVGVVSKELADLLCPMSSGCDASSIAKMEVSCDPSGRVSVLAIGSRES
jgi:hypothetical protein